jgi:ribosomal protein S18 acetylase RimI-like enzyme
MPLRIHEYDPRRLEAMAALYNRQTEGEPHIAPLTAERFERLVADKTYFDPALLLVATDGPDVVGWVHGCIAPRTEPWHDADKFAARIRMLLYRPEQLAAGALLVAEATSRLRGTGFLEIEAMHARAGYEPLCPATLPHVHLALEVAGYRAAQESIFMTATMPEGPPSLRSGPAFDLVESTEEMAHGGMRESWVGFEPRRIDAFRDGDRLGGIGWVLLPCLDRLGAPCVNIWTLGVGEQHRRRGVATALVSRVMALGYEMGARHASVSTQLWNAAAQGTYAKLGFTPHRMLIGREIRAG